MSDALIVLTTARDTNEARIIQALLRGAGIPAIVEGEALMDEWAATQRLLGRVGCAVKVPASARDEAERVIAEARAIGRGEEPPEEPDEG